MQGKQVDHFSIEKKLGAGGMGDVYLAVDKRLDRRVAIKVLPTETCSDEAMVMRFRREARAISSLSHPHICQLYDIGQHDGSDYLVMEYLDGETLADRLKRGAMALDEALQHAAAIADALAAAHRHGIVHRDLKPGNVMLTPDGVKLLDFGLAKLQSQTPVVGDDAPTAAMTAAPLTGKGTILGTFQYMSPEQIEGMAVDARTDIFAFGALLYEMLTGTQAFSGASPASLIGSIMHSEPPPLVDRLPLTPLALERVVRRCLAKNPDHRWQHAGDLADELKWIAEEKPGEQPLQPRSRKISSLAGWGLALVMLAGFAVLGLRHPEPEPLLPSWVNISPPAGVVDSGVPALSPNGRLLVFEADSHEGGRQLWLRSLNADNARPLAGTTGGSQPFFSPDGRSIGFFAGGALKTLDLDAGRIHTLYEGTGFAASGSWAGEGAGRILFTPSVQHGLMLISGAGGRVTEITTPDPEQDTFGHTWPQLLPDGEHFLYAQIAGEQAGIHLARFDDEPSNLIIPFDGVASTGIAYVPDGHLVYFRDGDLYAQRLDLEGMAAVGESVRIAEGIRSQGPGNVAFSISASGNLIYLDDAGWAEWQLVWLDRAGAELETLGEPGPYIDLAMVNSRPQLSDDGRWLALNRRQPKRKPELWILDTRHGTQLPLATEGYNAAPAWGPRAEQIAFGRVLDGPPEIFIRPLDHNGAEYPALISAVGLQPERWPNDWSTSGRYLMYQEQIAATGWDIHLLDMDTDPPISRPFTRMSASAQLGKISPDERWAVYASNLSGGWEFYLTTFPEHGRQWQISQGISGPAFWATDSSEIFYPGQDGTLMSVALEATDGEPEYSAPRPLLTGHRPAPFAISPDGERFLALKKIGDPPALPYTLVLDWSASLD